MKIKIFTLLLIVTFSLKAQDPLSLSGAVKQTLENNYGILLAKNNLAVAENNNTWGAAGGLPVINLGINQANRFDNRASSIVPDTRDDILSNSIVPNASVRWTIFSGMAIKTTKSNFDKYNQLAKIGLKATVEQTMYQLISGYYTALLQQERLQVFVSIMTLSRDRYSYQQQAKELGGASTFELLQAQNAFLTDSSNYMLQKVSFENAIRKLNQLMATDVSKTWSLSENLVVEAVTYNTDSLLSAVEENNSSLKLNEINHLIDQNNLALAKSAYHPSLSLSAGTDGNQSWVKYNAMDAVDSWSYDLYANFTLSYALFNGGNRKRKLANAKINLQSAELEQAELKASVKSQVFSAHEMYKTRRQMYTVAEENTRAAALNMQIAEEKFKTGAINSFNYRDIQMIFAQASLGKLQAAYNIVDANALLLLLTGEIAE